MCIAIYKPENQILSDETLKNCWDNNPDGAGFMYVENDILHVKKGYLNYEEFYNAYKEKEQTTVVLHFRIGTHGEINKEMTHPFNVTNELAFVHNGIISGVSTSKEYSDTWHFIEEILKPILIRHNSIIKLKAFQKLINDFIGWSKLIFMDNKGQCLIFNSEKGEEDKKTGIWYSNNSYKVAKRGIIYSDYQRENNVIHSSSGNDLLKINDECTLDVTWGALQKGEKGIVSFFMNNNACGFKVKNVTYYGVPIYYLSKCEEDIEDAELLEYNKFIFFNLNDPIIITKDTRKLKIGDYGYIDQIFGDGKTIKVKIISSENPGTYALLKNYIKHAKNEDEISYADFGI